ncbi:VENN motif pre-toxin domain-containing protein [Achromobacter xylosoxidans]
MTGAQAGRNAVENNFLDVVQLEDFAHRAKVGTGEERQKVIRDMVDTNVRQQDEIKEVCAKSPQQCQQRYGYLLDEWELFDDTIKRLAKDKSLPDDFRDYMPAVYMSDVDAGGIVAEHGWTKRFEAMGFDADTARVMAATLPAVVSSVGGGGSKGINKGAGKKSGVGGGVDGILPKDKTTSGGPAALGGSRKEKLINPDNNEAVANHTVVSSGRRPRFGSLIQFMRCLELMGPKVSPITTIGVGRFLVRTMVNKRPMVSWGTMKMGECLRMSIELSTMNVGMLIKNTIEN